jgi:GAF domain-containing protein
MGTDASYQPSGEKPVGLYSMLRPVIDGIVRQVQPLLSTSGVLALLMDEGEKEFYVSAAVYEDKITEKKMQSVRLSIEDGVIGEAFLRAEPLLVQATDSNAHFFQWLNQQVQYRHENMLAVPLRIENRSVGVLCAVNKREGGFGQTDAEVLTAVANLVALAIENSRMNDALSKEYENVIGLNQRKEQAIHHLSHEMKTPISVLSASLTLLEKRFPGKPSASWARIMDRARRNLDRLLNLQYEIGDMLRKGEF